MLFNSFQYIVFFFVITIVHFMTPYKKRWIPLLVGSYYFYMCWNPAYIVLIIFSTIVDYVAAHRMAQTESNRRRTGWLLTSLCVNLGLLFGFKYYNFFLDTVSEIFESLGVDYVLPHSELLLPVGISFYTFQTLSYTIDVYRGKLKPERHFGRFALYVSFFPQLVAGPIERATHLLPQFQQVHHFRIDRTISGLRLVLWGLFKKVVIADRLSEFVNLIYDSPEIYSGPTLLLATYFFAFQIYCDFSGYSDIAIGSARVLGFDLMQNFNLPYLADSITDFWRRWHISLSTWFRDYVYIPLGGSRVSRTSLWIRNVLIVFGVSGLWHGANWTFVIWGLIHGTLYLIDSKTAESRENFRASLGIPQGLWRAACIVVTFHCVLLTWVFFRASSATDAMRIVSSVMTNPVGMPYLGPSSVATALSVMLILFLACVQILQYRQRLPFYKSPYTAPIALRWSGYVLLTLGIAMLGRSNNEFVYFQF